MWWCSGNSKWGADNIWWLPSPLISGADLPALLHFEVSVDGRLSSPQVLNDYDALRAQTLLPLICRRHATGKNSINCASRNYIGPH